jgi:hypothetical protein
MVQDERKALAAFDRAIGLGQKGTYFLERAKSHLSLGNQAQARQDYQRAQQLGATIDSQTQTMFNSLLQ